MSIYHEQEGNWECFTIMGEQIDVMLSSTRIDPLASNPDEPRISVQARIKDSKSGRWVKLIDTLENSASDFGRDEVSLFGERLIAMKKAGEKDGRWRVSQGVIIDLENSMIDDVTKVLEALKLCR